MNKPADIEVRNMKENPVLTLAVAESCTGGLVGGLITAVPGASRYFKGGVTAYSNQAKIKLLKVPPSLLAREGAVSAIVAAAMAKNVKKLLEADVGVAVTGIAGPSGGTREKPVGLVYIAASDSTGEETQRFVFKGDRDSIRRQAAREAVKLAEEKLKRKL